MEITGSAAALPVQVSTVPTPCPRCRTGTVVTFGGYPFGLTGMLRTRRAANYWAIWTLEMPLYLEDVENWPQRYDFVLPAMALGIGSQPVNPAMAMELVRTFVAPLLSERHAALLEPGGQPSWQRIHFMYAKLVFESSQGTDTDVVSAATIINILFKHTTKPPRELVFPRFLEVSSFTRVCGYLGLPMAEPTVEFSERPHELYSFCKYCWLPEESHGVCHFHSTKTLPIAPVNGQPLCGSISLKQGQRLRPSFDGQVLALTTKEELALHDSNFVAPVLLPPSGLRNWLKERRPALAALVGEASSMPDTHALADLLAALYGARGGVVAEAIGGAVYLLTPVTTRAEGWLTAWAAKPRWGGARRRALPRQ